MSPSRGNIVFISEGILTGTGEYKVQNNVRNLCLFFFLLRRSQKELCYWKANQFQDVRLIYKYPMILVQDHILLLIKYKKQKSSI